MRYDLVLARITNVNILTRSRAEFNSRFFYFEASFFTCIPFFHNSNRQIIGLGWIAFGSREPGVIAAARSNTAGALFAAVKACPLLGSHDCAGSPGLNSARVVCSGCQGRAARRGNVLS